MKLEKRDNVLAKFSGMYRPNSFEAAMAISAYLHAGVKDRGGVEYIRHPLWICNRLAEEGESNEVLITALLHDTVEDTELTLRELENWFSKTICDAVDCLTFREGETRQEYIDRVAKNAIARKVKKEDLTHNMDIRRLKNRKNMSEKDLARIKVYAAEYDYLVGGMVGV